jgi:hypothetical protein
MSKIKNIAGAALPFAASLVPGIGPVLGAALGAGGGLLGGGGLKGALMGGLTGGLGGGLGNSIAGAAGLSGTGANMLSRALTGAAGGAMQGGGLKGALLGGALGAGSGYFGGGGNLGDIFGGGSEIGGFLGEAPTKINWTSGVPGSVLGVQPVAGTGSGLLGALGGGLGGGTSAYGAAAPVASGAISGFSNDAAASALEEQQRRALALMKPFMNEQFNPGDLQNTPGYQFNLDQGTKALNQAAAARGNYFSGQALTDATQFASGLADQTYNNAYQQWLADRSQRMQAAGASSGIMQGIGETRATNILNQGQNASQSLSALLGQLGGGTQQYNPQNGTYTNPQAQGGMSLDVLLRMLQGAA